MSTSWLTQLARNVERIRRGDLVDELLAHARVGFALRVLLEVLPDGRRERVERLEVADFAREGIVERRERFALHVEQVDAHRLGLAALRFVGKVVGPAHGALTVSPGVDLHDELFDAAIA